MKTTMVLAALMLLVSSFFMPKAQAGLFSPMWEWEQPKLVGKVKVIEERSDVVVRKIFYSPEGKRTEAQRLDERGKIVARYFFVYDKDGNLVVIECYAGNNPNPLRETVFYSEKGMIKVIDSFESPRRATLEYDEKKRIKEVIVIGAQGPSKAKWTFLYDDQGRFTGERYTNMEGAYAGKRMLAYNDNGFICEQIIYGSKDQIISKRTYNFDYDKTGNWVKKTVIWLDYSMPDKKPVEMKSMVTRKYIYYP